MKGKFLLGGIAGAACMAMASAWAAEPLDANLLAATYNVKLVPAMDECTGSPTTVEGVAVCDPANVNTDGTKFNFGRLLVKAKAGTAQILAVLNSGANKEKADKKALATKNLRVKLTVRVTRNSGTYPNSLPGPALTFQDVEVTCGDLSTPAVPASGNWVYKASLTGGPGANACDLPAGLADNRTSKEIISARIINETTTKVLAVPGVRRKL